MINYFLSFLLGGLTVWVADILLANYFEKKQGWCRLCGSSCRRSTHD